MATRIYFLVYCKGRLSAWVLIVWIIQEAPRSAFFSVPSISILIRVGFFFNESTKNVQEAIQNIQNMTKKANFSEYAHRHPSKCLSIKYFRPHCFLKAKETYPFCVESYFLYIIGNFFFKQS